MFNYLKNKVSDTLKHRYVRNTLLGVFFVSSIPFIPLFMIADELILLTNYLFKKGFNTFIKQSDTKSRKISMLDIFLKIAPFQLISTVGFYLFSLLSYIDSTDPSFTFSERKGLRTASSIFAIIGTIAASSPVIIYLGLKILAPIENLSYQINIKHLYSTFNNLTYGLSSYSVIAQLKKYFFFDQFKENIYKDTKININIFNDIAKAFVPNNTSHLINDEDLHILLEMVGQLDKNSLEEIVNSPTAPSESIYLASALLIKNYSQSLSKSKKEFLNILLTNPKLLSLTLDNQVRLDFFEKMNIDVTAKTENWSPESCQRLGDLLDQNRLNYLFDRIDSSDVVDFINSLAINSVISITHNASQYIFTKHNGKFKTEHFLTTRTLDSNTLRNLIRLAYFILPTNLGQTDIYGTCSSISHSFIIINKISTDFINVTIKNNQTKAERLSEFYQTSENPTAKSQDDDPFENWFDHNSSFPNFGSYPNFGSSPNLSPDQLFDKLKTKLLDDLQKYQPNLYPMVKNIFDTHPKNECFNNEEKGKSLYKKLSRFIHPDRCRSANNPTDQSNPDLLNEFGHYFKIVTCLLELCEGKSITKEYIDSLTYTPPKTNQTRRP